MKTVTISKEEEAALLEVIRMAQKHFDLSENNDDVTLSKLARRIERISPDKVES